MSRKKHPSRMSIEEFRKGGFDPTRSRQPRRTGEHDNQSAYFKILDLNIRQHPELTFIFAIPNAAKRSPQVIREMLDEGLKKGVPDICIPISRHGHGAAWIENKFGDNKMSPDQLRFRDFLIEQGYAFKTCYTLDNQLDFTEWYLGIELIR